MKLNKIFIAISVLAVFTFSACDDFEDSVTPSPEVPEGCQGVYFPASNPQLIELEPTEATEMTLTIAREVSSGAVEVPIVQEINDDDVFEVPETVSFADGETEVDFKVTFPTAAEGTTYNLKLAVEGDEFVNPYSSQIPYVEANATRIQWVSVDEPMIYVDGAFSGGYGVSSYPMYVQAEKAEVSGAVRYRFKNVYDVATGTDEDGIHDGYPYNDPGDFDESKDYTTTIEIDNATGEVFMFAHEIGVDWGYGMISIGSLFGNISDDKDANPLGRKNGDVITFPASSLYFSEAGYNNGAAYGASSPTIIYMTKEAFIAANLKIEDFNDVEYEEIPGEVGEYESNAYSDVWSQSISAAIDADPDNEESEYKNLFYLSDLYAGGYGLAFYYYEEDGKVIIPENQATGLEYMGQMVYVSPSGDIDTSVEVNSKGVTIYSLGLMFHYEDGTILGEFSEIFYYSEEAVSYSKSDFMGDFIMSGESQFGDGPTEMEVSISEGSDESSLIITGVDYAVEIIADFDAANSMLSIAPQTLPDFELSSGVYDATLYTTDAGGVSTTSVIDFTFNMQGNLIIAESSVGDGYLIDSEAAGGWVDGYYDLVFTPVEEETKSASVEAGSYRGLTVFSTLKERTEDVVSGPDFSIQGNKMSKKSLKKNLPNSVIF
ncbi:hypothetical protein BY457_106142 [Marinilabilia salmonicolor]|uniref:hypothetical protein n=1 Tax=Marinilabilia salmonicolor TaxID=989 RepID=UPI000D08236A|nr:hypothetical protein [Marinilabilia salmonicolor]PRZ00316.1 hypothetical protein BY457_106142 [Marinilabilia salmonicolor]